MITDLVLNNLNIEMSEMTKNTVILFQNSELKYEFLKEFVKITDPDYKGIDYYTTTDNRIVLKEIITYKPTSIFMVDNEQRIVLTVEAPFILQCTDPYDLWFCSIDDGSIVLRAFTEYKGYQSDWNKGITEVYKKIINGQYGCYKRYAN